MLRSRLLSVWKQMAWAGGAGAMDRRPAMGGLPGFLRPRVHQINLAMTSNFACVIKVTPPRLGK